MYIFGSTWKLRRKKISIYRSCPWRMLSSGWVFRSTATSWLSLWTQHVRHVENPKSLLTSGACWEAQEDALSLLKLLVSCLDASFESCRCPLCLDFSNINSNFKKSTQNENSNFDTKPWKKKGGIRNESRIKAFCQSLERTDLTWAPGFCNLYKIGS